LKKISRALISVSDKTGIVELAKKLSDHKIEIVSTGGTARSLREAGLAVRDISDLTGFPEILSGRVKTLHPLVHGGILAMREEPEHQAQVAANNISYIDMVVVNLYPFAATVAKPDLKVEDAIENIDIGGPAMIRSSAKNFRDVVVVVEPESYSDIIRELDANGNISLQTRFSLARKAFAHTAKYDAAIADFLANRIDSSENGLAISEAQDMPERISISLTRRMPLRYGENPHQRAALYNGDSERGVATSQQLQGRELSYNNLLDCDAAWSLVSEFDETACVIIKHTNPCGVAIADTLIEAYRQANATDPVSAFGGIIALNRTVDKETAEEIAKVFSEVIIAPEFTPEAEHVFSAKKNLRLLQTGAKNFGPRDREIKRISGGVLVQDYDNLLLDPAKLKVVTKREPTEAERRALTFAWTICKHVKSNAIVYAREGQLVSVGAGQMSRVDSVKLAASKAVLPLAGSVMASDAFFPFRDNLDEAAKHGITAVIEPGGSVRDQEVIQAANEYNLAMIFTGVRHFKH